MLNIPTKKLIEFEKCYNNHRVNIAACNVFFQNMVMLNGRHVYIDRKTYEENFLNVLSSIEMVTSPIDAFIPGATDDEGENYHKIFTVNQEVAEFKEIASIITIEVLEDTLGMTNETVMFIKEHPEKLVIVHEDLFIYYSLFKYLDQIDLIRMKIYSNYTPVIEYIVDNISLKDWKNYIHTSRINEIKYIEKCEDLIFNPDIAVAQKFYMIEHGDIPVINVKNLIMKLVNNNILKTDIFVVLGVFLILSFAITDIGNNKIEDSKCAKYVRDVLSKL